MQDISLDQLYVFINVAQQGSFSAAARHIHRAQSAVSYAIANLEEQLDVQLFDRSSRRPTLTEQGTALLEDARDVLARVDRLSARAKGFASGIEPRVSLAVHMVFPLKLLTRVLKEFRAEFPDVSLMLHSEILGGVVQLIHDGVCDVGISGPMDGFGRSITTRRLAEFPLVTVAASGHPIATHDEVVAKEVARRYTQIVVMDRSEITQGTDFGVVGAQTWRVADVHTKLAMLREGLGWGNMPLHLVHDDLLDGALTTLYVEGLEDFQSIPMYAIHPTSAPPGPAASWLIERLDRAASQAVERCAQYRTQRPGE